MSGYSERFADALLFATELHAEQERKGSGVPYITHLIGVAALVGDHGGSEDQVIGALLHDAIEDCIETRPDLPDEIASRYGEDVLMMVQSVSDTEVHPKPPWKERKEAYISHVEHAEDGDPSLLISVADKLYNARTILRDLNVIGDEIWDRFKATREQSLWYYRALADAFGQKNWPTETQAELANELGRVVSQLEAG